MWREKAAEGKLDLLTNIDFRMTGTSLFSDIVLPAATWYEKQDLSTTDMHPFVHALNAAITPAWESRTDYDAFLGLADKVSELAHTHLGTRTDVIAAPLTHDTSTKWRNHTALSVTGKTENVTLFPVSPCLGLSPLSVTTQKSVRRCAP